jgi:ATP-dependent Lhr-like helicase
MEDAGRVRRGYFVEGMGGSQFALAGAVDRLRSSEARAPVTLAAADPANPYGASLPWPDHDRGRASRAAGASVVLIDGRLAAFVERGGKRILTYGEPDLPALAAALADAPARGRRVVATVDGESAIGTPLGAALLEAGFVESYKGLTRR